MLVKMTLSRRIGVAAALGLLLLTIPARAGGFGLFVELPPAVSGDAPATDDNAALFVVRAVGCHGPGAAVSAKAEGLVDGKRISLPLRLESLGNDRYAVKRQWPSQGAWVVSLHAKSAHEMGTKMRFRPVVNILVPFHPAGQVQTVPETARPGTTGTARQIRTTYVPGNSKSRVIETTLQKIAATQSG